MPPSAVWMRPVLSADGAREAALLVAEELALHELGRDRAAVDRHERAFAPRAGLVNHARHQLLAGARLARDVHGRLAPRDLGDHRAHALQAAATGRPARRWRELRGTAAPLSFKAAVTSLRRSFKSSGLETKSKAPSFSARTAASTLPCAVITATGVPGHLALQPLDELEPVAVRQPHVGQAEVERLLAERLLRARDVEARARRDVHALEGDRQELADVGFVVDDKGDGFHKDSSFGCQRFGSANTMRNALPPPGRGW